MKLGRHAFLPSESIPDKFVAITYKTNEKQQAKLGPSIAIFIDHRVKVEVRNGFYFVLLRQIFIPEVFLEREKFPLQDYNHNSEKNVCAVSQVFV